MPASSRFDRPYSSKAARTNQQIHAQLKERILRALKSAIAPMDIKQIASTTGDSWQRLTGPLSELAESGQVNYTLIVSANATRKNKVFFLKPGTSAACLSATDRR